MGLDNGIVMRFKGSFEVPKYVKIEKAYETKPEMPEWDICYWRKFWGLRDEIVAVIPNSNYDGGEYDVSIKTLKRIQDIIYEQLKHPEKWDSPIWDFNEVINVLAQDIVNISWLIKFLRSEPHASAYFYDSY